jgi:hypothetical protein
MKVLHTSHTNQAICQAQGSLITLPLHMLDLISWDVCTAARNQIMKLKETNRTNLTSVYLRARL